MVFFIDQDEESVPCGLLAESYWVAHVDGVGQRCQLAIQCVSIHSYAYVAGILVPALEAPDRCLQYAETSLGYFQTEHCTALESLAALQHERLVHKYRGSIPRVKQIPTRV